MRDPESIDANGVARSNDAKPSLRFAGFIFDLDACTLARESGEAIALTRGEFALLRVFVARPGRVLSRDTMLTALGARRFEPFDRSVDMQVGRLRRKIELDPKEPRLIITVPGEGYRFDGLTKTVRSDPELPIAIPASENDDQRSEQDRRSGAPPEELGSAEAKPGGEVKLPEPPRRSRFALLAAGAVALLVVIGAGAWFLGVKRPATVASTPGEPVRLSMVVLPFVNLSGDSSQD
jgi:DNA-binding winged helix-turn-helix (wHTH) protein